MACGCIDAAEHAGYRGAWPLLKRVTDLVHPRLPEKALTREEQIARKMRRTNDESYTIPENQFLAWRRSGDARYKRSEEHTSELQSLMRISYAVYCLKKKKH